MGQSTLLIDRLKHELKGRGITYAQVGIGIGLSEASVKRMFSKRDLMLGRLDAICAVAQIELVDLTRGLDLEERLLNELTDKQEATLVADQMLFLTATCVLNLSTFENILETYEIDAARLVRAFVKLDRLGFLRLLPNNRYRLLVARTFRWLPDGPIQRYFKQNANAYFDSAFDGPDEFMGLLNARLSKTHAAALIDRLRRLARDISEQHADDARLPPAQRHAMSLLLAVRPWQLDFMRRLERKPAASGRARKVRIQR
ncbi:MAG: helix-turn-helix domain-containing protein [Burkholderiaceae bacterium]